MTPEQLRLLDFYRNEIELRGVAPTYARTAYVFGLKGKGGVHTRVRWLIENGHLVRLPGKRGLGLPGRPDLRNVPTAALRAELARREAAHG